MKKRIITLLLAMGMAMGSGLTAYATPARMEDGTLFDGDYYVNIVPDFSEHHVEFVLHFLHFGGKGNTVFDGTSDASHRER